ncbi:hypothetical protein ASPVEDRAFT_47339 [Aspergillus versicolor CBS 583.65]|uniref:DUF2252 domain-containing protein n=1 Tax=Aspergillus versicolor CBS 583.65 TaxID=1036611 RepID=A0A1L9Q2Y9_ASPVE|nr:uncharacterized protein ASPVEDRAFT_47339 [Aspergillus versicolor CBS 583.65]OJJ08133.1 hypothetical protein ASPVEDRAFT_47339 [Aspergillus versicolor CBS 583.65]
MTLEPPTAEQRGEEILNVFATAFGELLVADPAAFQVKFRKMAASAFAFYRGSACLFYHDLELQQKDDSFLNSESGRIWIHGDLHAENFGTYMDSQGRLIFNVNDFDEAYVGPFTWDVKRFVASIALIGYAKALSDKQITRLVRAYAAAYRERIHTLATSENQDQVPRFTLETAKGPLLDALRDARMETRVGLLDTMTEIHEYERRFTPGGGAVELDEATREKVVTAFNNYLQTLPEPKTQTGAYRVKDVVGRRGVGIGSAGLPSYNILLEGKSEAIENDVVIYMKQSTAAAVSRHVTNSAAASYFLHEGHRTVISQRALQAHADPWLGWTEIDGVGQLVAEVSPYAVDLDWSDINDVEEMATVVADLGRATAMMHGAGDNDSGHSELVPFSPEQAIDAAIAADEDGFMDALEEFAHRYSAQARLDHQLFVDLFRNGRIPGLAVDGEA